MLHISEHNENIVFKCKSEELKSDDVKGVLELMEKMPEKTAVVNLSGVSKIKKTTLNLLKTVSQQNQLSLCSLDADIFAVINLLNYDKYFNIYPDEISSIEKKPELKNRRFKIV